MLGVTGVVAGLIGGLAMGLCSEIGYRLHLFRSSLVWIDGSFLARITGGALSRTQTCLAGAVMHLVTSAVFGGVFGAAVTLLGLRPSLPIVCLYVFLLWLAMLFSALPMAGQGLAGRALGPHTWLEQLVLHVIFGIVFAWVVL